MEILVTEKQRLFMDSTADEVLYGGAAGGGKSYVQIIDALVYAVTYKKSKQLTLRKTFPELERSLIRTALEVYPKSIYSYNASKHTMEFKNGSLIDFGYCDTDNDVIKYQSLEYDTIRFDEATHFTQYQYEYLRTRLRGANDYPKQIKLTTNPGGIGHTYFKSNFVDPSPPNTEFEAYINGEKINRIFIPALVYDNTFLMKKDPNYVKRLQVLPEEQRKALLEGSWDLFEGQFFPEFSRQTHVVAPRAIDVEDRIYFVMDYGLDMFAGYFIALDQRNRAVVFREIYEPNVIISEAAEMIKSVARELPSPVYAYLAPTDLWNRRQETGKSMADIFRTHGIRLTKTSRSRVDGWLSMKEWLAPFEDETGERTARLTFFPECVNAIRCVPALLYDPKRASDASTQPHEITHANDALRYFCVYHTRPEARLPEETEEERWERAAAMELASPALFEVYSQNPLAGGDTSWACWGQGGYNGDRDINLH